MPPTAIERDASLGNEERARRRFARRRRRNVVVTEQDSVHASARGAQQDRDPAESARVTLLLGTRGSVWSGRWLVLLAARAEVATFASCRESRPATAPWNWSRKSTRPGLSTLPRRASQAQSHRPRFTNDEHWRRRLAHRHSLLLRPGGVVEQQSRRRAGLATEQPSRFPFRDRRGVDFGLEVVIGRQAGPRLC